MKKGTLAVVGLSYVGLPVAVLAKEKGWQVIGLDNIKAKVDAINAGHPPFADKELEESLKKNPIEATTDPAGIQKADVVIIAVATPVTSDNMPDLGPLKQAIQDILPHLKAGQVVVVESTINPGVMDEVVMPLLRQRSDLSFDADGYSEEALVVLHCPERVNPGDPKWSVRNIPRVIGGYSSEGVQKGKEIYESILDAKVMPLQNIREAEACKILENTFRDINIAFINEMAQSFAKLDIDVMNVIKGASTKPFAFMPHFPGNGVGGHCISVDPYYMIEKGRQVGFNHQFLKLARQINDHMPAYTVEQMETGMKAAGLSAGEATVALLGLAYKKDIDDLRESPALEVKKLLEAKGYKLNVFDPYVPAHSTVKTLDEALAGAHILMLATNHTAFVKDLTAEKIQGVGIKIVVDGKNALDGDAIAKAGIPYYGIGRKRLPA